MKKTTKENKKNLTSRSRTNLWIFVYLV